jgi:DNA replication protein DnaC
VAGLQRHHGEGDPNCPICGGLGYYRLDLPEDHPNFGRLFDCECRKAQVEAARLARLRKMGGLEALADKRLDTFDPDGVGLTGEQRANLRRVYERVVAYAEQPSGWLVIVGGYGCGKTHLAAAIANRQLELGNPALFVSVPDLLDHLRAAFQPDAGSGYDTRFDQVRDAPLLILDDLGVESPTPWAIEKLYQIFNHRYNAGLPTVITTNHNLTDLELRLRSRLADPDLGQVVTIIAPDYRRAGIDPNHSDLSSLGLYTHMRFETFDLRERELPPDERDNLRRAYDTALQYSQDSQGWLVLTGPYGCGKTHLAAAIANARQSRGETVLFVTVPDLLDHLRATFSPSSLVPYDQRFNEIKRAPLLVLDDLGTESATPWAREKLYQLFNHRYNACLPTVITTAYQIEVLDPRLATRMLDRKRSAVFAILAPAYRGGEDARRKPRFGDDRPA